MKRLIYCSIISLLIALLWTNYVIAADGVVEVSTPSAVTKDQDFQVDVYINPNSDDFYGFSFNLAFDPTVVKVVSTGKVLDSGNNAVQMEAEFKGNSSFAEGINRFDNKAGIIYYSALRLGQNHGVELKTRTKVVTVTFRPLSSTGLKLNFAPYDYKISDLSVAEDKKNCLIQLSNSAAKPLLYSISDNRCFIATAVYGSYLDPHVRALRDFRDNYLLTSIWGRSLVHFYYDNSPPLAHLISQHIGLRVAARIILTPLILVIAYPSQTLFALVVAGLVFLWLRKRLQAAGIIKGLISLIIIVFLTLTFVVERTEAEIPTGLTADLAGSLTGGDGRVDDKDLACLAQYYGSLTNLDKYDLNQDGVLDLYDMVELSKVYGQKDFRVMSIE